MSKSVKTLAIASAVAAAVAGTATITHQGQSIVILRPEFDPFPHLLSHAEHLFLRLMMDQSNLGDAAERAHQHDPHFDPSQILQTLLTNNALDEVTQ